MRRSSGCPEVNGNLVWSHRVIQSSVGKKRERSKFASYQLSVRNSSLIWTMREHSVPYLACRICTDNTSPHAHTRTFSRCARLRTPDVITRLVCLKNHSIIGHVFVECSFDPISSYFLITYCLTDATDWNQMNPLCTSALGGPSGQLAHPIPNTSCETKFCIDVSGEHTPTNLPTRNMSCQQEYDATITASEDPNLPRHSGASSSSQHPAASRVPTLLKLGSFGTSLTTSADYDYVASRTASRDLCGHGS